MINQETAEKLGVELELLQSTFEGYKVMSSEDIEALKSNVAQDSEELKKKYQAEGREVGRERALKDIKQGLGLNFEGVKNPQNLITAINEHIAAGANNDEFTNKISELSKALENSKSELEAYKSEVALKENQRVVTDGLNKEFSKFAGKTTIPIDDLFTLYTAKNTVKYDGESIKIYNGEDILKDDLLKPVSIEDSVKNFIEGSYLTEQKPKGGRGEGDSTNGPGNLTFEKFASSLTKQGIAEGSAEFNMKISEAVTQGIIEV